MPFLIDGASSSMLHVSLPKTRAHGDMAVVSPRKRHVSQFTTHHAMSWLISCRRCPSITMETLKLVMQAADGLF